MSCSLFCFSPPLLSALLCGVRAKNEKETATHAWAISHARSARSPGRPDERASDERARYLCSLRPQQAAYLSRLRQQAHNWGGGSVSRGCDPRGCVACCWRLRLPVLLLLLLFRRRLTLVAFLRLVTFRVGMMILELRVATYCIYLCSLRPRQAA